MARRMETGHGKMMLKWHRIRFHASSRRRCSAQLAATACSPADRHTLSKLSLAGEETASDRGRRLPCASVGWHTAGSLAGKQTLAHCYLLPHIPSHSVAPSLGAERWMTRRARVSPARLLFPIPALVLTTGPHLVRPARSTTLHRSIFCLPAAGRSISTSTQPLRLNTTTTHSLAQA
jgi:hypothetical protein